MRLLVVSDVTGYMRGGVPSSMVRLVDGLAKRGHAVALAGDIAPAGGEAARLFPIRIPTGPGLAGEVQQAIDAFRPDFVHVIAMGSRGLETLRPTLASQRWALTIHSLSPYEKKLHALHASDGLHYAARGLNFLPHTLAWKWLLRRGFIPHVIVHSPAMQDTVVRYGFAPSRVAMIPLGYDAPAVSAAAPPAVGEAPRIVTMGGIAHTKGQHDGLEAVALLRREMPGLRYRIVGEVRDKSYLQFLERTIERLGLRDCVRITPNVSHEEKERALQEADIYLQPSHEEGFCLAYIEAAAFVPRLVGADSGAIGLIGENDPGARTVPPRRPEALCAALRELLRAPLPEDLMARRAARLAARFSWAQFLDRHEALFQRALADSAAPQVTARIIRSPGATREP
ncbi:MAG TPA: glycosyltransferase family 4 protein [Albitalea sp.]|uniref:glycosyltransferase family 4 protein n=1 Tax=Piscinibacter sp. TaxID=1903157 RepID=UPI002ED471A6